MSIRRRVKQITSQARERREAAWKSYLDHVTAERVAPGVKEAHHRWKVASNAEKEAGWAQLPPWGEEEDARAWSSWFREVEEVIEVKGLGDDLTRVWPRQVPAPPEEPPGLWEELHAIASDGSGQQGALAQCAAARALMFLAIARSLRSLPPWRDSP